MWKGSPEKDRPPRSEVDVVEWKVCRRCFVGRKHGGVLGVANRDAGFDAIHVTGPTFLLDSNDSSRASSSRPASMRPNSLFPFLSFVMVQGTGRCKTSIQTIHFYPTNLDPQMGYGSKVSLQTGFNEPQTNTGLPKSKTPPSSSPRPLPRKLDGAMTGAFPPIQEA